MHCQNDRVQYKCRCSYVEIYNEVIYDLLDVAGNVCRTHPPRRRPLFAVHDALTEFFTGSPRTVIREDNRRVYLENATEVPLTSTAGAYEVRACCDSCAQKFI